MSRKTYSLSALAVGAVASLSMMSADGAEALAQASDAEAKSEDIALGEASENPDFETVPAESGAGEEITFVSKAVSQPLPGETIVAAAEDASNAGSLRELVTRVDAGALTDQMRCLAGAVYFESRGEPLAGQLAVAQVVINRSQDQRWPASYCGVVYQRAQFSFVKNGRMPRIRTSSAAWDRAKAIAHIAHEGMWESKAGDAVYFHAKYVSPRWSRRKERTAQIDTHIFYR
ncbi:MAG: cell wall hydrolase [Pseudomonadota bacterium]